ncbi:MAG: phosphate ABC transporter substrate-binding protein PstS [Deltaproteobacteria bacterium]|nr:phosphate ABC transporter substrate-binding protein PstS [Candidatus Zymogenaceae bacterium]
MKRALILVGVAAVLFFGFACSDGSVPEVSDIRGAGATFPYPLYAKMFDEYNSIFGVRVNYQGIGSSGGIKELLNKTVDFGGTDAFMTDAMLEETGGEIVHVPTCLGAVAVTYNLPNGTPILLSQDVLADIFLGKIERWNDERIASVNEGVELPDLLVIVVHRSDGSGTTNIFTDFLTSVSPEWADTVGVGKSVEWPAGIGAAKNSGVAGMIKETPGAVGYVELAYAVENDMAVALIENRSGNFPDPTRLDTVRTAAGDIPDDTRISLVNTTAVDGYPIAGFTWIILFRELNYDGRTREDARALVDLLWWMIHDGQIYCESLLYAPLSDDAVEKAEGIIKSITYDGEPLLQ